MTRDQWSYKVFNGADTLSGINIRVSFFADGSGPSVEFWRGVAFSHVEFYLWTRRNARKRIFVEFQSCANSWSFKRDDCTMAMHQWRDFGRRFLQQPWAREYMPAFDARRCFNFARFRDPDIFKFKMPDIPPKEMLIGAVFMLLRDAPGQYGTKEILQWLRGLGYCCDRNSLRRALTAQIAGLPEFCTRQNKQGRYYWVCDDPWFHPKFLAPIWERHACIVNYVTSGYGYGIGERA